MVLLLAACGGDDDGGGQADASADRDAAPGADAAPGTVTVRVTNDDAPIADATVFSSDLDGDVFAEGETDAAGEATIAVVAGGAVTVAYYDESYWGLHTMQEVQPGDVIRWGRTHSFDGETSVDVTLPVKSGTDNYLVGGPCSAVSGGSNALFATFYGWCERDPYTLVAVTSEAGLATGYQFLDDVDMATDPVVLDGAWQAVGTYGISLTDLPDGLGSVEVSERAYRHGTAYQINRSTVPDTTDEDFTMQHLPTFGLEHELIASMNFADAAQNLRKMDVTLTGADVEIASSEFLPGLVGDVSYDAEARTIDFPDPGEAWDFTAIDAYYVSDDEGDVDWYVQGPGGTASEVLPRLPDSLAGLVPPTSGDMTLYVSLDEVSVADGWDDLRALPETERVNLFTRELDEPFVWRRTYMSSVAPL